MLYKFHRINNFLFNLFLDSSLWFSNPGEFNDPFDMRFSSNLKMDSDFKEKTIENELSKTDFLSLGIQKDMVRNNVNQDFENFDQDNFLNKIVSTAIQNMGVCCFSEVFDNLLLWSHYTDGHKGVCLEFDPEHLKKIDNSILFETKYTDDFPHVYGAGDIQRAITTKSTCWNYEKEQRIVCPREGSVKFPQEAITSVIFGAKTDVSEIRRLIQLIKNCGYSHVVFKKAEIDSNKYRLTYSLID